MHRRGFRLHDSECFIRRAIVDEVNYKGDLGVLLCHGANDVVELFEKDRK